MNLGALIGLTIMVVSEAATLARVEPFYSWNTPICWTGFILFADSLVWRARGRSWIRSSPMEFTFLTIASILLWLVFEFYNLYIDNWYYTGLPENPFLRTFGYAWSFATIWPAIFEGADLIDVWRGSARGVSFGKPDIFFTVKNVRLASFVAIAGHHAIWRLPWGLGSFFFSIRLTSGSARNRLLPMAGLASGRG